jgi:HemY protein
LFRARADLAREHTKVGNSPIPAVIPLVRAPDDPGIDDDAPVVDEFADQIGAPKVQAGGWRGFWSRLGD